MNLKKLSDTVNKRLAGNPHYPNQKLIMQILRGAFPGARFTNAQENLFEVYGRDDGTGKFRQTAERVLAQLKSKYKVEDEEIRDDYFFVVCE